MILLNIIAFFIGISLYIFVHYTVFQSFNLLQIPQNINLLIIFSFSIIDILSFILSNFYYNIFIKYLYEIGVLWLGIIFIIFNYFWIIKLLFLGLNHFTITSGISLGLLNKILLTILLITVILGTISAKSILKITQYSIDKSNIYNQNKNLRIIQLSDLHLGIELSDDFLLKIVNKVNKNNPDVVFITGDFLDYTKKSVEKFTEILKQIRSKYGIYAVTGNHEYFGSYKSFKKIMKESRINVLENSNIVVSNLF